MTSSIDKLSADYDRFGIALRLYLAICVGVGGGLLCAVLLLVVRQ